VNRITVVLIITTVLTTAILILYVSYASYSSFKIHTSKPEMGDNYSLRVNLFSPDIEVTLYDIQSGEKADGYTTSYQVDYDTYYMSVFFVKVGNEYVINAKKNESMKSVVCKIGPNDKGYFIGGVDITPSYDRDGIEAIICYSIGFL
jgi:hypothetical protein